MARRTAGRPSKTGASKKKAPAPRKAAARTPAASSSATRRAQKAAPKKAAAKKSASKKPAPARKGATAVKKAPKKVLKTARKAARPTGKTVAKKVSTARIPAKAAPRKTAAKKAAPRKAAPKKPSAPKRAPAPKKKAAVRARVSSIDSRRRELEEMVPSPPSSLNMVRRGSAARTGRAEMAEHRAEDAHFTPSINGGDEDVNVEDAYFTGDEAPGGDNPTPDQDIVDEIGRALGVEYQDNEELRGADKLEDRDRHRWELDPASAEDYRDRD